MLGSDRLSQTPLDLHIHVCHLDYAPNKARVFFKLTDGALAPYFILEYRKKRKGRIHNYQRSCPMHFVTVK
jgi:hypothetical protein